VLCFLCGTDWIIKYYLLELRLPRYTNAVLSVSINSVECHTININADYIKIRKKLPKNYLKVCPSIRLERLRKTLKHLGQSVSLLRYQLFWYIFQIGTILEASDKRNRNTPHTYEVQCRKSISSSLFISSFACVIKPPEFYVPRLFIWFRILSV
jgi:hypothetical protein